MRGYFEIGVVGCKTHENIGTLWRSAYQLGASGIFTIGRRFRGQCSDVFKTSRHIPLREYEDFDQFINAMPYDCMIVGIEMGGTPLSSYQHPHRAIYLLGSEDNGLPKEASQHCLSVVSLESTGPNSYNVAVAGSIVMYHRVFIQEV